MNIKEPAILVLSSEDNAALVKHLAQEKRLTTSHGRAFCILRFFETMNESLEYGHTVIVSWGSLGEEPTERTPAMLATCRRSFHFWGAMRHPFEIDRNFREFPVESTFKDG